MQYSATESGSNRTLLILIPVFNDWSALTLLLRDVDRQLAGIGWRASLLLIDDGSTTAQPEALSEARATLERVDVLSLRRNLGHQRAIAVGLAYVEANYPCDAVLVMDGDGEDSPTDIPRLLARFDDHDGRRIVFAARTRRSEGVLFRLFYRLYRLVHYVFTGIHVRVGNFSVLPLDSVRSLVVVSDLWNHFAASIFKARLPFDMLPTNRAPRLAGNPTMNFTALVGHG